jgi:transposase
MVESIDHLSNTNLGKIAKSYTKIGLDCLFDSPRPGRPIKIDEDQKAWLAVVSYSEAPNGHSQWSLRILTDKMVELGYFDSMSHTMGQF